MNGTESENQALRQEVALLETENRELLSKNDDLTRKYVALQKTIESASENTAKQFKLAERVQSIVYSDSQPTTEEIAEKFSASTDEIVLALQALKLARKVKQIYTKKGFVWVKFDHPDKPIY